VIVHKDLSIVAMAIVTTIVVLIFLMLRGLANFTLWHPAYNFSSELIICSASVVKPLLDKLVEIYKARTKVEIY